MEKRLKRFLSLIVAVVMIVTMLPGSIVFAEDDLSADGEENQLSATVECTKAADCSADVHVEDCAKKQVDNETIQNQEETTEPVTEPEETTESATEPEETTVPECTGTEDCPAETHTETCGKTVVNDKADNVVNAPALVSVAVTTLPAKTSYAYGETLDVTGGKLTLTYDDGTTSEVDITAEMVSGYDVATSGQQELTVSYEGKTATFTVKVKQVLPLYAFGSDYHEMSTDQGYPTHSFSTDRGGNNIIPVSDLRTTGVVEFTEINSEVWINATSAGEGSVYYDTDDAIYVFRLFVHHSLYMHTEGNGGQHYFAMTVGQKVQNVYFTTDRSGNTIVPIDALVKDDIVSFEDLNEETNTLSLVGTSHGNGYITYTNNGENYKHEITVTGGNEYPGDGSGQQGQHNCENMDPHLFVSPLFAEQFCGQVTLGLGEEIPCFVYLHNGNEEKKIGFGDLIAIAPATLEETDYPYLIKVNDYGEGLIQYTEDGMTYSLKVINPAPAYGLYSAAEHKVDNQLTNFSGEAGEEKTAYLMWNSESAVPDAFSLSVNEDGTSPVAVTTVEATQEYIAFKFAIPQATSMWLHLYDGDGNVLASIRYGVEVSGSERHCTIEVDHNGQTVTVGIGMRMADAMTLNSSGGFRDTPNPNEDMNTSVCLAALINYGDKATQTVADESFYNSITNVSFEMVEWENFDQNDITKPHVSAVRKETAAGRETSFATITKASMKEGQGWLRMTFTYNEVEYRVYRMIQYSGPDISLTISADLTLDDLNAILANGAEVFLSWLEENYPVQAAQYDGVGFIDLHLPGKTYDGVITVDLCPDDGSYGKINSIRLIGQKGTKMRGLVAKSRVFGVQNITFENAVVNGEPTRTAILHNPPAKNRGDMIGSVNSCTFTNYEYAVADVGYGFVRNITECRFENCGTAILMDSVNLTSEFTTGLARFERNTFVNNKTAVCIKSIPDELTAFTTRINDNTFLFNDMDFDFSELDLGNKNGDKANFYFTRNYFGKNANGSTDDQMRGPASIAVKHNKVKVITNPVRKSTSFGNEYWVYSGTNQYSAIFNSEANNILVDSGSFATPAARTRSTDSDAEIPVSIVDDQGNEIAQWTF